MADNSAFKRQFAALLARAGDKADLVVRKTALTLQSSMIDKSPVDTGRFRSNWACGIGAINTATNAAPGSDAKGRTAVSLGAWKPGQTIFLSNSMPYAVRLEKGWSRQAPSGMVALTVQDFAEAVAKAAREVR